MRFSVHRSTLALGLAAVAAACSSDSSSAPKQAIAPDGASCTVGVLPTNGTTQSGTIHSSNCALNSSYQDDSGATASYAINLTAGKIYMVRDSLPTSISGWASLVLVGTSAADTSQHVVLTQAVANNDNQGNVDEIWFYATTTGTYSLRVAGTQLADTNIAYAVRAFSCPVIATVAATDTVYADSASALGATGCSQNSTWWSSSDSSIVNYYLVGFNAGQTREVNVYSSAFDAGYILGGAGFNDMGDVQGGSYNSDYDLGANNYEGLTADSAGTYVLQVGSQPYGGTGSYSVTLIPQSMLPPSHVVSPPHARSMHLSQQQRVHVVR